MSTQENGTDFVFFEKRIRLINFETLLQRVTQHRGPYCWNTERAEVALKWYKRFLYLAYKYPTEKLVPGPDVDEVWHEHILDTKSYVQDCLTLFGAYLHHCPDKTESGIDTNALNNTTGLYLKHFGTCPQQELGQFSRCSACSEPGIVAAQTTTRVETRLKMTH